MSQATVPPRQRFQMPTSTWRRELLARTFKVWAVVATFFGLAMLVIFFVRLGSDVVMWFRETPKEIREDNVKLEAKAVEARKTEEFIAARMAEIDKEMQIELKDEPDEKEKEKIRKAYDGMKAKETGDLAITVREYLKDAEGIRTDTSPGALLGHFFTAGPSNKAHDAGIAPALLGSLFLIGITVLLAVPLGVGAAVYLEEYRSTSWFAQVIQVNINNLAGVPSVVYGILGAFVFVELIFKHLEDRFPTIAARNVLGGGMTLALLSLPLIIVSAQDAIRAVPVSLRHASLALGATRWQTIWRVVLPSALPGTLTGVILALSRALGEAAPILLFGANLYVNQNPTLFSRFTILPMQIFDWTGRPSDIWRYNAGLASAILVLVLLLLNGTAIYMRGRAQRKLKW